MDLQFSQAGPDYKITPPSSRHLVLTACLGRSQGSRDYEWAGKSFHRLVGGGSDSAPLLQWYTAALWCNPPHFTKSSVQWVGTLYLWTAGSIVKRLRWPPPVFSEEAEARQVTAWGQAPHPNSATLGPELSTASSRELPCARPSRNGEEMEEFLPFPPCQQLAAQPNQKGSPP